MTSDTSRLYQKSFTLYFYISIDMLMLIKDVTIVRKMVMRRIVKLIYSSKLYLNIA